MFSKNNKVSAAGEFTAAPKKLSKLSYISMMMARTAIIGIAYKELAKAVTIAVRYSAVRLQGFKDSSPGAKPEENVVLDYQMQQYRVFKALSLAYSLLWNTRFILDFMKTTQEALNNGNMAAADDLPELHATLSGCKAMFTVWAHENIEDCRKCCGGQGFLMSSGIAKIAPDFSEWVTVEGEQVILSLQCARYLIKAVDEAVAGGKDKLAPSIQYVAETGAPVDLGKNIDATSVLSMLQYRSRVAVQRLHKTFKAALASGKSFDEALNSVAILAYRTTQAHCCYRMLLMNHQALEKFFADQPETKAVLDNLFMLQGLMQISENCAAYMSEDTVDIVDDKIRQLLQAIRPEAVALTDAFGFIDYQLKSTLGKHDGNVYEAIYDEAKKNPLNTSGKMSGWGNYSQVLDLDFLDECAKTQRTVAPPGKL
jgi:acyl-CoA oxidase